MPDGYKLTASDKEAIRASTERISDLARRYGVYPNAIRNIRRERAVSIPVGQQGELVLRRRVVERPCRLDVPGVIDIFYAARTDESRQALAEQYGIDIERVAAIQAGTLYPAITRLCVLPS